MKPTYAKLEGKKVVPCTFEEMLARLQENKTLTGKDGGLGEVVRRTGIGEQSFVSTVFLGLNHGWGDEELWFETMVFANGPDATKFIEWNDFQDRYRTYDEAEKGHEYVVRRIREGGKP